MAAKTSWHESKLRHCHPMHVIIYRRLPVSEGLCVSDLPLSFVPTPRGNFRFLDPLTNFTAFSLTQSVWAYLCFSFGSVFFITFQFSVLCARLIWLLVDVWAHMSKSCRIVSQNLKTALLWTPSTTDSINQITSRILSPPGQFFPVSIKSSVTLSRPGG